MMMRHRSFVPLLTVLFTAAGCAGHANIHYQERLACTLVITSSSQSGGQGVPGAGNYFSVFTIQGVENNNKATAAFTFDPSHLYVKVGDKKLTPITQGRVGQGVLKQPVTVSAGQTTGYLGRVVFEIPADLKPGTTSVGSSNLYYDGADVLMFREGQAPQFSGVCDTDKLP